MALTRSKTWLAPCLPGCPELAKLASVSNPEGPGGGSHLGLFADDPERATTCKY